MNDAARPVPAPAAPGADPRASFAPLAPLVASMVSLCVGTSWAKTLFPVTGAAGMTALRVGLAALLLAAVQRPWRWRVGGAQARAVAAYGVVLACMNLSFYAALRTLPLGVAIAIEFLGPLGVALAGSRRPSDLAWVALAAAGIGLLALPHGSRAGLDPAGVGWALSAAFFWAMYILTGKRASGMLPAGRVVCLGLCVAALVAVPVGVASAGRALLHPGVLGVGLGVAVLCSALPYRLEMAALRRLPAHIFGVVLSLEPAVGALAALVIIGEALGARQWLGIAAVVAASAGSTLAQAAAGRPPLQGEPPAAI